MPSIRANILSRIPESAEVRICYHLYRQTRVVNQRSGEDDVLKPANYHEFRGCEGELQEPDGTLWNTYFESIKGYGDPYGDNWTSMRNLVMQLNSLHRVTKRMAALEPDCVAFVRPDLLYCDAWETVAFLACASDARLVLIPNWQPWGGENDRFAMCGRKAFLAYGNRIEEILRYCETNRRPLVAEKLLKYSLYRARLKVRYVSWRAKRVRTNGKVVNESFRKERPLGKIRSLLGSLQRHRVIVGKWF